MLHVGMSKNKKLLNLVLILGYLHAIIITQNSKCPPSCPPSCLPTRGEAGIVSQLYVAISNQALINAPNLAPKYVVALQKCRPLWKFWSAAAELSEDGGRRGETGLQCNVGGSSTSPLFPWGKKKTKSKKKKMRIKKSEQVWTFFGQITSMNAMLIFSRSLQKVKESPSRII
ncbi:hypothetical protein V8C43DRAFT_9634 [Trichoderma afarasin]